MSEQRSPSQAFSTTTDLRLIVSDHPVFQPHVLALPDVHLIEQAQSIVLAAQFLYHITVSYHALPDGTYEILPVGDNDFTTIASAAHLPDAILGQVTAFMESPAFIAQQVARLTAR